MAALTGIIRPRTSNICMSDESSKIGAVNNGTAGRRGDRRVGQSTRRYFAICYRLTRMWLRARASGDVTPFELARRSTKYAGKMVESAGLHVVCKGDLPDPERPVLLVSNHVSWIDPYVVNAVSGARFVAKSEIANWPIIGTIANGFGSFFHDRGNFRDARRTVSELSSALGRGFSVGVFPEATTTSGAEILPFYPAMFESAVESGARVQPVAIRYLESDGSHCLAPAYIENVTLLDTLREMFQRPYITVEVEFGPVFDSSGLCRRELARRANESIANMLSLAPAPARYGFASNEEPWTWLRHF